MVSSSPGDGQATSAGSPTSRPLITVVLGAFAADGTPRHARADLLIDVTVSLSLAHPDTRCAVGGARPLRRCGGFPIVVLRVGPPVVGDIAPAIAV